MKGFKRYCKGNLEKQIPFRILQIKKYEKNTSNNNSRFVRCSWLSNESSSGNDVDGTWGNYTIQEGESDLFLINNRSGKKYKFLLQEVT